MLTHEAANRPVLLHPLSDATQRVAKVGEEGGEVVGALLKRAEGRADTAHLLAELGDVFLAALAAADQLGVTPSTIIAARWADVSQRTRDESGIH